MKNTSLLYCTVIASLFISFSAHAQPQKGKFISAGVGLGITSPDDESTAMGNGFYAQGEYIYANSSWFGIRPYAGFIVTDAANDTKLQDELGYEVSTKAFFVGGKVRLLAPIPYVAPYLETGIGLSFGTFKTHTEFTDVEKNGAISHIPFALGLALGRNHNFDLAFTYQFHQAAKQFSGALAFGYTFALD